MVDFYGGFIRGILGKTISVFALFICLCHLTGCFNSIGGGTAEYLLAANRGTNTVPDGGAGSLSVPESLSLSIDENGPAMTATLPYTGSNGVVPQSCEIQALSNITEASPCACVSGACRVGIQGKTDVYGQGSFTFRLTGSGVSSNLGKAVVKIRQVVISPLSGLEKDQKVTVGEMIGSPLVVLVRNSEDIPVSGVKVSWKALEESGQISSCTETSDSKGLAQCSWTLGAKSGSQGVEAAIFSGQSKASFSVSAVGGTATKLSYLDQPSDTTAGLPWVRPPQVLFQDAYGNRSSSSADVTLTIGSNPSLGTLSGKTTAKAVDGIASFSDLSINKAGIDYTLKASSPALTEVVSSAFRVNSGAAAKLVFTQQPGGAAAGKVFATQPVVMIQDSYGNQVTNGADTGAVLTIGLSSGTGTLLGALSVGSTLGVSSWRNLLIEPPGSKALIVTKPDLTTSGGSGSLSVTSDIFENKANPPPVITDLKTRATSGSVSLSWAVSSNATGYNILRGTSPDSLVQIATSRTNAYTDSTVSNGVLYYYAVQAVSVSGTSASSQNVKAKPLSTPSIKSFAVNDTAGVGALVISWNGSVGASGYKVKHSTKSGSAAQGTEACAVGASEGRTCTVSGLTPGTKYYFIVNAINDDSGSVDSEEGYEVVPRVLVLSSLEPGNRQIKVKYESVGAIINVRYGTRPGSYTSSILGGRDEVVVPGLVNGATYYFQLEAGYPSEGLFLGGVLHSAEKAGSPDGPQAFAITSALSESDAVTLMWETSLGASSYIVKYGTSSGSHSATFVTGFRGTSIKVTGLTNGTTYYFMVTAVNGSGTQDASAEFASVPALPTLQPTLSEIKDQTNLVKVSDWFIEVPFTLGGSSTFTCNGTVTVSSSDTYFIPHGSLSLSGTYPSCNLGVAARGKAVGTTVITLKATHGSEVVTRNFNFIVRPGIPTEAAAAYSTVLAVPSYTGKAMLVRHGANGALAEVAFDSAGRVSASSTVTITEAKSSGWQSGRTMPFSAFYSGATVYVATWYDQSGKGNHATQSSEEKQPVMVKDGTLETGIVFTPANENHFSIPYTSSLDFHSGYSIIATAAQTEPLRENEDGDNKAAIFTQRWKSGATIVLAGYNRSAGQGRRGVGYGIFLGFCLSSGGCHLRLGGGMVPNLTTVVYGHYDGNILGVCADRENCSETESVGPLAPSNGEYYIGRSPRGDDYFPMKLNEIILYTKSLGNLK